RRSSVRRARSADPPESGDVSAAAPALLATSRLRPSARARSRSRLRRIARRSPLALIGAAIVGTVVILALGAPLIAGQDPIEQSLGRALAPPFWDTHGSLGNLLGTDHLGRDIWARVVYGSRISLTVGVAAALLGGSIGVAAGVIAGFYRGKVDAVVMRIVDLNLAFPLILLALAIAAIVGPSLQNLIMLMAHPCPTCWRRWW
ncbi:MAG: hypothetical protein M3069_12640, partial [Chloroflexota bacterium]|nr:hypothetical protein [Chloroflexota bacterium]